MLIMCDPRAGIRGAKRRRAERLLHPSGTLFRGTYTAALEGNGVLPGQFSSTANVATVEQR